MPDNEVEIFHGGTQPDSAYAAAIGLRAYSFQRGVVFAEGSYAAQVLADQHDIDVIPALDRRRPVLPGQYSVRYLSANGARYDGKERYGSVAEAQKDTARRLDGTSSYVTFWVLDHTDAVVCAATRKGNGSSLRAWNIRDVQEGATS